MEKSEIGIFYLIKGRIISEAVPVSTIEPSGAVRKYPGKHHALWSELQKKDPDLDDLNCYELPRGRVSYDEKKKKFEITADQRILEVDRFINLIIEEFHLKRPDVEFQEDENYRCSICEND